MTDFSAAISIFLDMKFSSCPKWISGLCQWVAARFYGRRLPTVTLAEGLAQCRFSASRVCLIGAQRSPLGTGTSAHVGAASRKWGKSSAPAPRALGPLTVGLAIQVVEFVWVDHCRASSHPRGQPITNCHAGHEPEPVSRVTLRPTRGMPLRVQTAIGRLASVPLILAAVHNC